MNYGNNGLVLLAEEIYTDITDEGNKDCHQFHRLLGHQFGNSFFSAVKRPPPVQVQAICHSMQSALRENGKNTKIYLQPSVEAKQYNVNMASRLRHYVIEHIKCWNQFLNLVI